MSLGVPGVPWHTQMLTDHLTLLQPGGTDYAPLITTDYWHTRIFRPSDGPVIVFSRKKNQLENRARIDGFSYPVYQFKKSLGNIIPRTALGSRS